MSEIEQTDPTVEQAQQEKMGQMVKDYFAKHQASPFKEFQATENNQMAVDMDQDFEKIITNEFKDDTSAVLGEYVSSLVRDLMNNLSADELKELEELEELEELQNLQDTENESESEKE